MALAGIVRSMRHSDSTHPIAQCFLNDAGIGTMNALGELTWLNSDDLGEMLSE